MTRGDYTLGDLLNSAELELELLTGGEEALSSTLAGAHAIELENPAKWIDSGWMMLTMGVRLRNKPQAQRDLIAELQELGASCLGFGVGLSFKCVPPALLDEARRRNFPVVLIPENTQFRDVTKAVFHSTVGIESTTFQRLSSIQQNLLRAFADDHPLESIVQRLGRLVHSTVAVISQDAQVDVATGTLPVAGISGSLAEHAGFPLVQFDLGEWQIVGAPVDTSRGPSARWLVVASKKSTVTNDLARAAIQVTAPLIDALLRMNVTNRGQDRAIRKSVLDCALDEATTASDSRTLGTRIAALGIDFCSDVRTTVIRQRVAHPGVAPTTHSAPDLLAWLHTRLEVAGARYLLSERPSEIVLVAAWDDTLAKDLQALGEGWANVSVGVGRRVGCTDDIRTSHRDAQIAVQQLNLRSHATVMQFADLDVVTQLLAEVPPERFAATAAPIAAMLAENPIQLEALRAYFAMNRDVKAAADSIFLHSNTLRYRLERLEQALGRSLREPAVTASLYCVLTLMDDLVPPTGTTAAHSDVGLAGAGAQMAAG